MPIIKVWCLPADLSEERLRELHKAIVAAAVSVRELGLKGEQDMVTLFPKDMMSYGLGTEIVIEVTELWSKPERTDEVRLELSEKLVAAVKAKFTDARVMSYITPFDRRQGFCMTPEGLGGQVFIDKVGLDEILDLRHRILRTGMPIETAHFTGDEEESTWHIAAFLINQDGHNFGDPICCASFMLNSYEEKPAWQLRGMASDVDYQGHGVGNRLLAWAERRLSRDKRSHFMWCNAREPAVKFYEKNGWQCVSDVFDIPTAGPHRKMTKSL